MKLRKLLPFKFLKKAGEKGQAVVEFVLLLAVMAVITSSFVFLLNRNLALYWAHAANLIINDDPGVKSVNLD